MSDIKFESLREEHIPGIMKIEEAIFPMPWTEGMFRQELEDNFMSRARVAVLEERVIAYMIAWFLREEIHLLNVAVAPEHQRRGVGRRLVEMLIAEAARSGRELITLEVRAGNHAARTLYDRLGFQVVGIRSNYYEDEREDAVVMVLKLDDVRADQENVDG